MFAIVIYLHGNLESFTAVLEEIDRRAYSKSSALVDVVGYGPNPMELASTWSSFPLSPPRSWQSRL